MFEVGFAVGGLVGAFITWAILRKGANDHLPDDSNGPAVARSLRDYTKTGRAANERDMRR